VLYEHRLQKVVCRVTTKAVGITSTRAHAGRSEPGLKFFPRIPGTYPVGTHQVLLEENKLHKTFRKIEPLHLILKNRCVHIHKKCGWRFILYTGYIWAFTIVVVYSFMN
jgi:hypothetical protein